MRKSRPHDEVDPRFWIQDFQTWVQSEIVPIGEYLTVLEQRCFVHRTEVRPETDSDQAARSRLAALKRQIARRVFQAGGEFRANSVVVRSADGVSFTVHLPGG